MPAARGQDDARLSCRWYSATAYYMPANHESGAFSTILIAGRWCIIRSIGIVECAVLGYSNGGRPGEEKGTFYFC